MAHSLRTRMAAWTAAGVLGAGLVAGGVAQAVSTPSPSNPPSSSNGGPDGKRGPEGKAKGKHHGHRWGHLGGGHMLHGEGVVKTKDGYRAVVIQRGTVASVSPTSLQLRSDDGFTASYAVSADTWVRKGREQRQPTALTVGDVATVVATRTGNTLTATRVLAHPARPTGSPARAR